MIDRKQSVLQQLILYHTSNEEELAKQLQITIRQLNYVITQINEDLEGLGYPKILKNNGNYLIDPQSKKVLSNNFKLRELMIDSPARVNIILLLILSKESYISLDHFAYIFTLSKNTILNELKRCRTLLSEYELTLVYSRRNGYEIKGAEWNQRSLLHQIIIDLNQYFGNEFILHLLSDLTDDLEKISNTLHQIEEMLDIVYTDEDYFQLVPFMTIIRQRIRRGLTIEEFDSKEISEIATTQEYQSLMYSETFPKVSKSEYVYFAIHLLSSKVATIPQLNKEELQDLSNALRDFIEIFESQAMVIFNDKSELLEKLFSHFKPAYYRIKYHLTFENVMYEQIISKYRVLHNFVKRSVSPLETYFKTSLPDKEIAYITLFVGGHLLEKGESRHEERNKKAVIVCPNGISFSKLMEEDLRSLFPEIIFYPTISIREYKGFILPHELVFSPVPIDTEKELFLVNTLSLDEDKIQLRHHVISKLFHLDMPSINVTDLVSLIKNYATINSEKDLTEAIHRYLLIYNDTKGSSKSHQTHGLSLSAMLEESSIQIIDYRINWNDALKLVCHPLILDKKITDDYARALQEEYKEKPIHIMLKSKLLLPHLDPYIYQQKLGFSLLVLKDGILYNDQMIHFILLMTTPDKTSHLPFLLELRDLVAKENFSDLLLEANSADDIIKQIKYMEKHKE
ncbi:BglG family transcription antiterminator [Streptococcus porcinus]|uniref:BglG family transcription antiterminator n=1 Tax=Streptococcus porcinus TaxID=1340 RepID=UPI0010CACE61|nr:BglG family transcription antiterminator [Streptococcus porcinus]VTT42602.1 PTS multi-domain regulator [Streptococcus porcinus]